MVDLYRDTQAALAHGKTAHAVIAVVNLERAVCRSLDLDVFDRDMVEAILDELHCRAWPDPRTRPVERERRAVRSHSTPMGIGPSRTYAPGRLEGTCRGSGYW